MFISGDVRIVRQGEKKSIWTFLLSRGERCANAVGWIELTVSLLNADPPKYRKMSTTGEEYTKQELSPVYTPFFGVMGASAAMIFTGKYLIILLIAQIFCCCYDSPIQLWVPRTERLSPERE